MARTAHDIGSPATERLPAWFKQDIPDMEKIRTMKKDFRASGLHTVCESAFCPNMGKCWEQGVATFMILGEICTRACRFCAVKTGRPMPVDPDEPQNVALTVSQLGLRYVVITSVTRDDLLDGGSRQFAATVRAIRKICPETKIELLIPDFLNDLQCLKEISLVKPEVVGHNIETVRRLSRVIRPQSAYDRSLKVLENLRQLEPASFIKSSLMVGLGETDDDVAEAMEDLVRAGCDLLAIGQYLAPTRLKRHIEVQRFVSPEKFEQYRQQGLELGFKHVMSAPLVRSSFIAEQGYEQCFRKTKEGK